MFAHVEQEGSFRVLFAGAHPINGEGEIAELIFKLSDDVSVNPVIRITDIKLNGEIIEASGDSANVILTTTVVSDDGKSSLPDKFALEQNYPNPFNPSTEISFSLPFSSDVQLLIYDLHGQLIKELVSGSMPPGNHTVSWNGSNSAGNRVSSGVYFYYLKASSGSYTYSKTRKMLLLK